MSRSRLRFFSSPEFVAVRYSTTWWGWPKVEVVPNPTVITLAPGLYFGHPETVAKVKDEIRVKMREGK